MTIVIVNWNSGRQLLDAVRSVASFHDGCVQEVVIVDNASSDGSLELAEKGADGPYPLVAVRNSENKGFGAACNQGASLATGAFVLFLNPDARVLRGSIRLAVEFMTRHSSRDVGVVGVQLIDGSGVIGRTCARFPSAAVLIAQASGVNRLPGLRHLNMHLTAWAHDRTSSVDHVIGAFYLIRRAVFESLGGFDPTYFLYLEDLDLSLRARRAGWQVVYLAEAQAFHAGGGVSRQAMSFRLFHSVRSRLLYAWQHLSGWHAWLVLLVTLTVEPTSRVCWALCRWKLEEIGHTLGAFLRLAREIPAIVASSRAAR